MEVSSSFYIGDSIPSGSCTFYVEPSIHLIGKGHPIRISLCYNDSGPASALADARSIDGVIKVDGNSFRLLNISKIQNDRPSFIFDNSDLIVSFIFRALDNNCKIIAYVCDYRFSEFLHIARCFWDSFNKIDRSINFNSIDNDYHKLSIIVDRASMHKAEKAIHHHFRNTGFNTGII